MSLRDVEEGFVSSIHSPKESARFGLPVHRITVGMSARRARLQALGLVEDALERLTGGVVVVRYPSEFFELSRLLGSAPWSLFGSSSLLYWEDRRKPTESTQAHAGAGIRVEAWSGDRRTLNSIVRSSFDGYVSHYNSNPLLNSDLVGHGYAEWATQSLENGENLCFAAWVEDQAVAVAVVAVVDEVWEIELAGVIPDAQGKGVYATLIAHLSASARQRRQRLVISTQAHNTQVQRLWVRAGFEPIYSLETVHLAKL